MPSHRVPIIFDEETFYDLKKLVKKGKYKNIGETVRTALILLNTIIDLRKDGYSKIKCYKKGDDESREIILKVNP